MARPQKNNLEYFSLDVMMDDSIEIVQAEHGMAGFGILISLWQKIYQNSYYLTWDKKTQILFSKRTNTDNEIINEVINSCLDWGVFDQELFKKYQILTSRGIQKRYITAMSQLKRKNIVMTSEFVLVDENTKKLITELTPVNSEFTIVSSGNPPEETPQKKRKEKKGKENKEEKERDYISFQKEPGDEIILSGEAEDLFHSIQNIFMIQNLQVLDDLRESCQTFTYNEERYVPEIVKNSLDKCKTVASMQKHIKEPWSYFVKVYSEDLAKAKRFQEFSDKKKEEKTGNLEAEEQFEILKNPNTRDQANDVAMSIYRTMSPHFRNMSEGGVAFYSDGNVFVKSEFIREYNKQKFP